jgi:hypothetical protein
MMEHEKASRQKREAKISFGLQYKYTCKVDVVIVFNFKSKRCRICSRLVWVYNPLQNYLASRNRSRFVILII